MSKYGALALICGIIGHLSGPFYFFCQEVLGSKSSPMCFARIMSIQLLNVTYDRLEPRLLEANLQLVLSRLKL